MSVSSTELPSLNLDIVAEAGDWPDLDLMRPWFETCAKGIQSSVPIALQGGEVSVVLTDDATMQGINNEHRGQDKPTNVLSFPAMAPEQLQSLDGSRPFLLGDLVFAFETMDREAKAGEISLHDHMCHLIVHGFLHLLGYDHEQDDEADAMESAETQILAGLGIADPYAV